MRKAAIERILGLLTQKYGPRKWHSNSSPLAVLIQTILSQNTSDKNSGRAFSSLIAPFPRWEDLAETEVDRISDCIRIGGLGEIKAKRIRQALGEIRRKRDSLELDFLSELPLDKARDWLKELPGVGTKTAGCVLLFALGRPVLPVDTHIFRVSKRLGLIDLRASVEQAHILLESLVPQNEVYQFHVLMIEHGRRVCRARRPLCNECVLREYCPGYLELG